MQRRGSKARCGGLLIRALALFVAMSLLLGLPGPAYPAKSQTVTGVVVPLFMRPGNAWQILIQAKAAHPSVPLIAIINPSSGPGTMEDYAFASAIQQLQAAGIAVLGYVYTSYGSRAASAVEADLDSYHSWYGVDGIMFDEMSNRVSYESYYSTLVQYAHSAGLKFTMGNPGGDVPSSYLGIFDSIVIYENTGLPSLSYLGGWHAAYPKAGFSFVAMGVSSLDAGFIQSASNYVGYLYITDDTLPNPYDTVPTYFASLMAALDPGNQSTTVTPPVDVPPSNTTVTPPTNDTVSLPANDTVGPQDNTTVTAPTNVTETTPTNATETVPQNVTVSDPTPNPAENVSTVTPPGSVLPPENASLADTSSTTSQGTSPAASDAGQELWPAFAGVLVSIIFLMMIPRFIDSVSVTGRLNLSSNMSQGHGTLAWSNLLWPLHGSAVQD